ncbi:uncharacterized protein METZ01_LOCUS360213, partial [marine metagenome]
GLRRRDPGRRSARRGASGRTGGNARPVSPLLGTCSLWRCRTVRPGQHPLHQEQRHVLRRRLSIPHRRNWARGSGLLDHRGLRGGSRRLGPVGRRVGEGHDHRCRHGLQRGRRDDHRGRPHQGPAVGPRRLGRGRCDDRRLPDGRVADRLFEPLHHVRRNLRVRALGRRCAPRLGDRPGADGPVRRPRGRSRCLRGRYHAADPGRRQRV